MSHPSLNMLSSSVVVASSQTGVDRWLFYICLQARIFNHTNEVHDNLGKDDLVQKACLIWKINRTSSSTASKVSTGCQLSECSEETLANGITKISSNLQPRQFLEGIRINLMKSFSEQGCLAWGYGDSSLSKPILSVVAPNRHKILI